MGCNFVIVISACAGTIQYYGDGWHALAGVYNALYINPETQKIVISASAGTLL